MATTQSYQSTTIELANSIVTIESGRVARVDRDDGVTEYAGPLDPQTIEALKEVADAEG